MNKTAKRSSKAPAEGGKRLHPRRRAVGIRDVARIARVSTASVSRALNQPESVSAEVRARIELAIERTGYLPDAAARALSMRRSRTLGAVIPTIDNAIFAQGIEAAQKFLSERRYNLLLATSGYDPRAEFEQSRTLIERGVDGLLFMGDSHVPELYRLLTSRGIPFVNTGVYSPERPYSCVGFDNRDAAVRATRYLLDLGHRRLAMLAGITRDNDRASQRLEGFRAALAERRLKPAAVHESPYRFAEARAGARKILHSDHSPTAIFCGNDILALGALLEAQALGIGVPERLSIVGFDDLELARHQQPPLTTMRVPTQQMWELACEVLVAALAGNPIPVHREIEVSLIVRGSTGPAPGRAPLGADSAPRM